MIDSSSLLRVIWLLKGCITWDVAWIRPPFSFLRREFGRWSAVAATVTLLSSVDAISRGTMVPNVVSTKADEFLPLPTMFWKFLEMLFSYVDVWYIFSPCESFLGISFMFYTDAQWPSAGSVSRAWSLSSCSRLPGSDYTVGQSTLKLLWKSIMTSSCRWPFDFDRKGLVWRVFSTGICLPRIIVGFLWSLLWDLICCAPL